MVLVCRGGDRSLVTASPGQEEGKTGLRGEGRWSWGGKSWLLKTDTVLFQEETQKVRNVKKKRKVGSQKLVRGKIHPGKSLFFLGKVEWGNESKKRRGG